MSDASVMNFYYTLLCSADNITESMEAEFVITPYLLKLFDSFGKLLYNLAMEDKLKHITYFANSMKV